MKKNNKQKIIFLQNGALDIRTFIIYNQSIMLNRIRLSTDDSYWAGILSDLGAIVSAANAPNGGIRFVAPGEKLSASELAGHIERLKAGRLKELGADELSEAERNLLLALPGTASELKTLAGYAEGSKTHTIETLVYNIRKKMGAGFVKLNNGVYEL